MPKLAAPLRRALCVIAIAALSGCGGGGGGGGGGGTPTATPVDCGAGTAQILGKLVAPNGQTPIGGADVAIASAVGCVAQTASDGTFHFRNVPAAPTTATATKGLFSVSAEVAPGATPASIVVPASAVRLAYVPGVFDTIEAVVQRLGFTATQMSEADLATADLGQYHAVLLNCGLEESAVFDGPTLSALQGYVAAGGRLYASDWAYTYVENAFPNRVNFLSPDARVGNAAENLAATVHDPALRVALGKTTARISFDLDGWVVIDSAPAGTEVLLTGPVPMSHPDTGAPVTLQGKPYAVRFAHGEGRVTYTSFHNEAQTTADMDRLLEQMLFAL